MSLFSRLAVGATVLWCGGVLFAQAPNELEQNRLFRQADVILKDAPDALKAIAVDKKNGDLKRYNALRVAQDLAGKKSDLVYYSVPVDQFDYKRCPADQKRGLKRNRQVK